MSKLQKRTRLTLKIVLYASFACYALALGYLLFGRTAWGGGMTLGEYIRWHTNLVPFKSILMYIRALSDSSMNREIPVLNLLGNLLMLLPMGLYLPGFIKKLRRVGIFILWMTVILLVIEAAQLLLRRGSFDIDDMILNMAGALAGFTAYSGISGALQRKTGTGLPAE
jgi:glycopeptide antibiotics resistance protein